MEKTQVARPKTLTRRQAIELGKQFVDELSEEFGITFIYWFDGSIATKKYVAGKSDIDIVIIPDESCDYGRIGLRIAHKMEEYGETYGRVFKKGRYISIIDPMIFLSVDLLRKFHSFYHDLMKPALDKHQCLKRIRLDANEVAEWEKRWNQQMSKKK